MTFTPDETKLLLSILEQLSLSPKQPDAVQTMQTLQSIIAKLNTPPIDTDGDE